MSIIAYSQASLTFYRSCRLLPELPQKQLKLLEKFKDAKTDKRDKVLENMKNDISFVGNGYIQD